MVDSNLRSIASGKVRSNLHNYISYNFYTDIFNSQVPITVVYTEGEQPREIQVDRKTLVPLVQGISMPIELRCALIAHSRAYQ